jgi:hypothetical protein
MVSSAPSTSPAEPDVNAYFTQQIVGGPVVLAMGPSAGLRQLPRQGVAVRWLGGQASLTALAARSLLAARPNEVLVGHPVSVPALRRMRRSVLLGLMSLVLVVWTALLLTAGWWFRQQGLLP